MDRKISEIKARILEFAEHQGLRKNRVAQLMGLSYHSFRGPALSSPPNSQGIQTLLRQYPQLSPDWLLLGRGPMIRVISEKNTATEEERSASSKAPETPYASADVPALIGAISSLVEVLTHANTISDEARLAYKRLADAERTIGELRLRLAQVETEFAEAKIS